MQTAQDWPAGSECLEHVSRTTATCVDPAACLDSGCADLNTAIHPCEECGRSCAAAAVVVIGFRCTALPQQCLSSSAFVLGVSHERRTKTNKFNLLLAAILFDYMLLLQQGMLVCVVLLDVVTLIRDSSEAVELYIAY